MSDHGLLTPVSAGTPAHEATSDAAVLAAMVAFEEALVRALVRTDQAPAAVLEPLTAVCTPAGLDPDALARGAVAGGNPAIPLVDALRARVADRDVARWLHHGATSQDVVDTALVLVARSVLDLVAGDLAAAGHTVAGLGRAHRDTVLAGRTLTQQALPITFGLKAATWLGGLQDALVAVRAASARLPVQLGGPVGSLSAYGEAGPAVLEAAAAQLGLVAPVTAWHTRRSVWADSCAALSATCGALGTIAADVLVLSQTEIGELREGSGGPSSSMPHKANPAQSGLIASAARQVPALLSVVATSAAAENERPAGAWHAEWEPLRLALRLTGGAAFRTSAMLESLVVDADAMRRHADELVEKLGRDDATVARDVRTSGLWVDRALDRWAEEE